MASPVSTGGGNHYIQIPVVVTDPVCGESTAVSPEKSLNRFVRFVAFGEWAGNAFGALAFVWATVVMLGGFCSSLSSEDFWFAAVMIFIEAFRVFSRNYTLDNQSLFGTTRALRWISLSFARMLMRPQEGNEVVLIMGLCIKVVDQIPLGTYFRTALTMQMSKWQLRGAPQLTSDQRRIRVLQLWVVLVAYLILAIGNIGSDLYFRIKKGAVRSPYVALLIAETVTGILAQVVAVLLLNLRPRRIVHLTSRPCGRKLVSFAKVISAVWLAYNSTLTLLPHILPVYAVSMFNTSFTVVVLSFGSLQPPTTENNSIFDRWLHITLHLLFLWDILMGFHGCPFCTQISFFILAALLVGNLQIPAAVTQVVLSTLRLRRLCGAHAHHDYYLQPQVYNQNLVPSITVFYTLAFCEGAFYIMACILGVFSFFPCRSLLLRSGFTGQWGSKAVDLYYRRVYTTRMETGVLAAGSMMTLDTFAMESLKSSSQEVRLIGVRVLDSLLQESDSSKMLISRITMSSEAMSALISMLGGTEVQDEGGMRLFAARVTANIAGHLRIAEAPAGMVKSVSSLLDAEKLSLTSTRNGENNAGNHHTYGTSAKERNRGLSWVCHCWQRTKDKWSVPDEPPLTQQDSFTVMGMVILRRLAHDPDNCVEIVKATTLISKIIGLITYTTDNHNSVILCSSLHLVRRLVSTGGKIGVTIRQELSDSPFLIDNLVGICEDSRSSPEVLMLAMDIIAKLALEENARQEVGSKQVIICKLVHSFLGQDEANDQESLRMAAGEALVNLTIESPANCSAILEVLGCHLIKDLKDMLCEAEYRIYMCTAASLLQNLCAHSRDKLTSLPGAGEHLRSTLPAVMENIVSTEGKQLETWIGLASQICSISECFIFDLESQSNNVGARVVRKLMGTLSSNMKPRCQYPRMRRVIVEMVISFVTSYPGYQTMLRDEGVMETLSKVAMTPSKVEKYRVFSGVDGVVLECGLPLRDLVDRAKGLIGHATPYPGS